MTDPGLERDPQEQPTVPQPTLEPGTTEVVADEVARPDATRAWRPPRWVLGATAAGLALVTVIAHIVGVTTASAGDAATGTTFALVAIWTSIPGFLLGLAAVVLGWGRGWGVAAMVVSLLGNPFLLLQLLNFFGG
jgi:hypothetical protein